MVEVGTLEVEVLELVVVVLWNSQFWKTKKKKHSARATRMHDEGVTTYNVKKCIAVRLKME
jgi:hypothetical protein